MKSIEERAKEWGEYIAKCRPYIRVDGKTYHTSEVSGLTNIMVMSYIAGANKQKEIDDALLLKLKSSWEEEAQINHNDESNYKQGYHDAVKKACDWLKKELQELAMDEVKDNFLENDFKVILKSQVPDWLRDFRKAMEN